MRSTSRSSRDELSAFELLEFSLQSHVLRLVRWTQPRSEPAATIPPQVAEKCVCHRQYIKTILCNFHNNDSGLRDETPVSENGEISNQVIALNYHFGANLAASR